MSIQGFPDEIFYPVFPGINDQPQAPTSKVAGNGADFIERYNKLVDAIAPSIQLDFSTTETDLAITLSHYFLLMLPVPFATYLANPNTVAWEILADEDPWNFNESELQEPVKFVGLNTVFTVGLFAGGGYGGGNPLDDSYLEVVQMEGRASFIDLPTVLATNNETWNNLVGIYPMEPNVKITLRPTNTKPEMNQLIP